MNVGNDIVDFSVAPVDNHDVDFPEIHDSAVTATTQTKSLMPVLDEKAWNFCKALSTSKMLPESLRATSEHDTTADIYMICGLGNSLGLDFFQAINSIYCLPGALPALYVRAKRALVLRAGGIFKTETVDIVKGIAYCVITRAGVDYTGTFTVDDAIRRGKLYRDDKGQVRACLTRAGKSTPWIDWPIMILNRAVGRACDKAYSDALLGLASVEDIQDVQFASAVEPIVDLQPKQSIEVSQVDLNAALKPTINQKKATIVGM